MNEGMRPHIAPSILVHLPPLQRLSLLLQLLFPSLSPYSYLRGKSTDSNNTQHTHTKHLSRSPFSLVLFNLFGCDRSSLVCAYASLLGEMNGWQAALPPYRQSVRPGGRAGGQGSLPKRAWHSQAGLEIKSHVDRTRRRKPRSKSEHFSRISFSYPLSIS